MSTIEQRNFSEGKHYPNEKQNTEKQTSDSQEIAFADIRIMRNKTLAPFGANEKQSKKHSGDSSQSSKKKKSRAANLREWRKNNPDKVKEHRKSPADIKKGTIITGSLETAKELPKFSN